MHAETHACMRIKLNQRRLQGIFQVLVHFGIAVIFRVAGSGWCLPILLVLRVWGVQIQHARWLGGPLADRTRRRARQSGCDADRGRGAGSGLTVPLPYFGARHKVKERMRDMREKGEGGGWG